MKMHNSTILQSCQIHLHAGRFTIDYIFYYLHFSQDISYNFALFIFCHIRELKQEYNHCNNLVKRSNIFRLNMLSNIVPTDLNLSYLGQEGIKTNMWTIMHGFVENLHVLYSIKSMTVSMLFFIVVAFTRRVKPVHMNQCSVHVLSL